MEEELKDIIHAVGIEDGDYQFLEGLAETFFAQHTKDEVLELFCKAYYRGRKDFAAKVKSYEEDLIYYKDCFKSVREDRNRLDEELRRLLVKYSEEGGFKREKQPFYMCWVEGERGPQLQHDTIEQAKAEAKRLAECSNKRTYVLAPIMKYITVTIASEQPIEDSDNLPF